jgi:hypothetical protein
MENPRDLRKRSEGYRRISPPCAPIARVEGRRGRLPAAERGSARPGAGRERPDQGRLAWQATTGYG